VRSHSARVGVTGRFRAGHGVIGRAKPATTGQVKTGHLREGRRLWIRSFLPADAGIQVTPTEVFQRIEQDGKQAGGPWIRPPEYAGSVGVTMFESGSSGDGTVNRSDEHDHCAVRRTTPTESAMWLTETLAAASDRGPESSILFHICRSVGSLCALRDHEPPAEVTKRWMARAKPLLYS